MSKPIWACLASLFALAIGCRPGRGMEAPQVPDTPKSRPAPEIAVDAYNPMEPPGEDGQKCTADMLNATSHPSPAVPCVWGISGNAYVSTSRAMPLPAPVTVGGATFTDAGARSIRLDNNDYRSGADVNMVHADLKGKAFSASLSRLTVACYLTQTETAPGWYRFDTICNRGGLWIALQSTNGGKAGRLYFGSHGQDDAGKSTYSPLIEVRPGKTYWVNLMFDGPAGKGCLAVFDPENNFAQVGDTVACGERTGGTISNRIGFGRVDGINQGTFTGSTYFDHVMFELNGAFPIFPKGDASQSRPGIPAAGTRNDTKLPFIYVNASSAPAGMSVGDRSEPDGVRRHGRPEPAPEEGCRKPPERPHERLHESTRAP